MNPVIRYISLLLICGLMLPFYDNIKNEPGKIYACLPKTQTIKYSLSGEINENSFSFIRDVVANILPALKNLN
jgi:hypothetical protein